MTRQEFFQRYLSIAKAATAGTPIFPSVVLSVAALESSNGNSRLTREANNFFGIKAFDSWKGSKYKIDTTEYENGQAVTVPAFFRKYDLPQDSFADYVKLITSADRYRAALKATNASDQVDAIKEAGYSTDPHYTTKVGEILDTLKGWVDEVKKKAPGQLGLCSDFWGLGMHLISY